MSATDETHTPATLDAAHYPSSWTPNPGDPVRFTDVTAFPGQVANVLHYGNGVVTLHIPAVGIAVASVLAIRPVSANAAAANLRAGDHIQVVDTTGLNRLVKQGDIGVVTNVDGADIRIKLLLSSNSVIDQHCSAGHLRLCSIRNDIRNAA